MDIIQYNGVHKFVGVLDNPLFYRASFFFLSFFFVFYLFIFFYGYSTNNIQIETYEHYKIYNNYLNYKLQRKEEMKIKN